LHSSVANGYLLLSGVDVNKFMRLKYADFSSSSAAAAAAGQLSKGAGSMNHLHAATET